MKIYNSSGVEILDIQVDDSSVRYRSIMADDSLTLQFSTTGPVTVPRGAYVDFEGARYTLFYPENFKKNSTRDFAYTLVLHGWREALKLYKYKDLSAKPYRLKFPLTARPIDFLQLLVDNMNLHDSGWAVGDCVESDEKLISINHEWCFDVLNRLAQEFNTEWEITGKTIHLRKVEKFKDTPLPLSYGMGNGFKTGVGRQNDDDRQPIGRLYVQGGERNIDYSEYGSSSLLLPESATLVYDGKTYRTDPDGMYVTRDGNTNTAEDSYDGSSHYPKRDGTISEVIVVDADKHFYDIRDTSIPASLDFRDCRIPGEKATIVFQSGALSGREFDLEQTDSDLTGYIHAERRFKIVPAELDGQVMPGGVFVPSVGDKYAIFNIRMPEAYISDNVTQTGASWDMFREAVKYFAEEESDKFSFTGGLDGVWSRSRWLEIGGKIVPGGHVLFSDPQFQPAGILIRITAVKDYVNKPHKPEITLSNAPVSGSFSSDLGKLEAEEVVREADKKEVIRFTKRQYRDAKETMSMLEAALLNFSGSINPVTVQTMQLLVGDESLQFRFVNNKTNPSPVTHSVVFNPSTKVLTAAAGIIQHMTIGITSLKKSHAASEYKYWDMTPYTSPALDPDKAYYLYARCVTSDAPPGIFLLSETAIGMESVADQYHFLVGILNSEQDGDRSFAPLYGYSEILPGRITTDRIVSQDGKTYFDLLNGVIGGRIKFISSGAETDLEGWAEDVTGDITDTQQAAADAEAKAQQAIAAGQAAVADFNDKVGELQHQIDGEVSNWFYPYSPTLSNYPASDWTTNVEKDRHIGDTFTNTQPSPAADAGKSWRFVKNSSVYSWTLIADSDAIKALQQAAQAQATADGKSTTFLVQPVKYHLGDTWVLNADRTINGVSYKQGEILTATQDSTAFSEAHWIKRVRYTDDTAVDNLQISSVNLLNNSCDFRAAGWNGGWGSNGGGYTIDNDVLFNGKPTLRTVVGNGLLHSWLKLENDVEYTYCAMVRSNENATWPSGAIPLHFQAGLNNQNQSKYTIIKYDTTTISNQWKLIYTTFKLTQDADSFRPFFYRGTGSTIYNIAFFGLVKGNKPLLVPTSSESDRQALVNEAKQTGIDAQNSANAAQDAINDLDTYVDHAFKDGVIDAAEAKAIEKYINSVNEIMAKAEASYNKTYANTYLEGTPKTNLLNAKINLWGQRDTLLSSINTAISGGTTTPAQKTAVDNAFATFNTLMSTFQNALEDANRAIQAKLDSLSTDKANAAKNEANAYTVNQLKRTETTVDARSLDVNTYYPVVIKMNPAFPYRIKLYRTLYNGAADGIPPWSTHAGGFSVNCEWTSIGSGWGVIPVRRFIERFSYSWSNVLPVGTIQQMSQSSYEYIHVRGGSRYYFVIEGATGVEVSLKTAAFTQYDESVSPRSSVTAPVITTDAINTIAADALAKANTCKAITDKFGTTVNGGLISTVMMVLRELNSAYETAGISGIQGVQRNNPAFWAGGTYAKALALIEFLSKISSGTTPSTKEYENLAKITMLHDGSAKLGDFIIEVSGRIVMVDPTTGVPRLVFSVNDIPAVSDLAGAPGSGSANNVAASLYNSLDAEYTLPDTINVEKEGSNITITTPRIFIYVNAVAKDVRGFATFILRLYRNGSMYSEVESVSVSVANGNNVFQNEKAVNKTIKNCPSGVYSLRISTYGALVGEAPSSIVGAINASTLSWNFTQAGIRRLEFGLDGFFALWENFLFHMSKNSGLTIEGAVKIRGNTDMPGVLLSASVGSTGGWEKVWGAKKHATQTAVKNSAGRYTVYHSIGHTNYQVTATALTANRSCYIVSKETSSFVIEWRSIGSSPALIDTRFDFQITGNNYNT